MVVRRHAQPHHPLVGRAERRRSEEEVVPDGEDEVRPGAHDAGREGVVVGPDRAVRRGARAGRRPRDEAVGPEGHGPLGPAAAAAEALVEGGGVGVHME